MVFQFLAVLHTKAHAGLCRVERPRLNERIFFV